MTLVVIGFLNFVVRNREHAKLRRLAVESDEILMELEVTFFKLKFQL